MTRRVRVVVSGRVQGVCYRMCARDKATELGVTGWVRNRSDGSVEAVAEGSPEALQAFVDWCRRGPPHARVTGVAEEPCDPSGEFDSFRIAF